MALHPHWYLPTSGDGHEIVGWVHSRAATDDPREVGRAPSLAYLTAVAQAADQLGFESVLTPVGTWCEDPWITTSALIAATQQLAYIVALRPDAASPTLVAQMATTFQRMSGGRLHLNVVVGSDEDEQHRFGDWTEHDARYARAAEFIEILRGAWSGTPYDLDGEHYRVRGATVSEPPQPRPRLFMGGASPAALDTAARHADVFLCWGEPPDAVADRIRSVRERAADRPADLGPIEFGIRLHVIARPTADEAWAEADRLLRGVDPQAIEVAQEKFRQSTSVGQARMNALHEGRTDRLQVSPNLWAGFGLVRRHAGTALVGSYEDVADRLAEYHDLGITHAILSGQPHLEEAFQVAEGVLPILRKRSLLPAPVAG
jgi:alkanesulfonate monooxygenase